MVPPRAFHRCSPSLGLCNLLFLMEGPLPSHGLLAFPSCTPRARGHSGGLGKGLLNEWLEGQLLWEETSSHLPYQGKDAVPRTPTWALRSWPCGPEVPTVPGASAAGV